MFFISASLKTIYKGYACHRPWRPGSCGKDRRAVDKPVKLASHREFTTWRAELMVNLLSSALPVSAARLPLLL